MNIVTKPDCPPCTKLKNMLTKLNIGFNECSLSDLPKNFQEIITSYPTVFLGTNYLFSGAPGSIESLKNLLISRGVL